MMMDFNSFYEVSRTADFIRSRNYLRVALQFPDELLKDSTRVAKALRSEVGRGVRLYVLADTAYGSCCVDEVGASHVDAECVVHYGHACMSPTSTLPAMFVFGKASIDTHACVESLRLCLSSTKKSVLVLYGLEYGHALDNLKAATDELLQQCDFNSELYYADVVGSEINPSGDCITDTNLVKIQNGVNTSSEFICEEDENKFVQSNCGGKLKNFACYFLGGLKWSIPLGCKMEDFLIFWIGPENTAFSNVSLTFNNCEIVRYDADNSCLMKESSDVKRILMRRYYLVEKAKDANIVGILVGTLAVAGYLIIIKKIKELIEGAGKKSYTLVMGRPNSAKLANFPECDVFVYVSCAQTALLDSKDFLAPVITPFEAVLAFSRGRHWTGEYMINFQDLIASIKPDEVCATEEARFSFIRGGYMEDLQPQDIENEGKEEERSLALAEITEKALSLQHQHSNSLVFKGTATSGTEFFAARSYQGLNMEYENPAPESVLIGRSGRASGYVNEKQQAD